MWQGRKDSNLRMPESKSGALTNLATPLQRTALICSGYRQKEYLLQRKTLRKNPSNLNNAKEDAAAN